MSTEHSAVVLERNGNWNDRYVAWSMIFYLLQTSVFGKEPIRFWKPRLRVDGAQSIDIFPVSHVNKQRPESIHQGGATDIMETNRQ